MAVQKAKVETSNDHRPTIKAVFRFIATTESRKNLPFLSVVAGYPHRDPIALRRQIILVLLFSVLSYARARMRASFEPEKKTYFLILLGTQNDTVYSVLIPLLLNEELRMKPNPLMTKKGNPLKIARPEKGFFDSACMGKNLDSNDSLLNCSDFERSKRQRRKDDKLKIKILQFLIYFFNNLGFGAKLR